MSNSCTLYLPKVGTIYKVIFTIPKWLELEQYLPFTERTDAEIEETEEIAKQLNELSGFYKVASEGQITYEWFNKYLFFNLRNVKTKEIIEVFDKNPKYVKPPSNYQEEQIKDREAKKYRAVFRFKNGELCWETYSDHFGENFGGNISLKFPKLEGLLEICVDLFVIDKMR